MGGGGGTPSVPPQQIALQEEQAAALREQRERLGESARRQDLLDPFLFQALGLTPQFEDVRTQTGTRRVFDGGGGSAKAGAGRRDGGRDFEGTLSRRRNRFTDEPIFEDIRTLTGFEQDPIFQQRQELEQLLLDRQIAAAKGDLPVNPALLRDIAEQSRELEETLRKNLGPGFATSTPGIEAHGDFSERELIAKDAARRGDLVTAGNLLGQRESARGQLLGQILSLNNPQFASQFGALATGFGNAQSPFTSQQAIAGEFGNQPSALESLLIAAGGAAAGAGTSFGLEKAFPTGPQTPGTGTGGNQLAGNFGGVAGGVAGGTFGGPIGAGIGSVLGQQLFSNVFA